MRSIFPETLDNDRGQSSIDFIFGFGVFLLTFIFAISFVTGLFTPFQPDAIDLSSVAYRTSALLVEDPGWFIGVSGIPAGSPSWETYPLNDTEATGAGLRIGLANNKSTPNMLSIDKINAFNVLANDNYSIARDKMGLNGSIESGSIQYDFNITLVMNTTLPSSTNGVKNVTLLNVTSPSSHNNNVELFERKVMVDTGKQLFLNCSISPDQNYQWINISNITPDNYDNITIRIYNALGGVNKIGWSSASGIIPPSSTWVYGDDYMVYLNGDPVYNFLTSGVNLNSSDILEVVIHNSALRDPSGNLYPNIKFIYLHANSPMFPGGSYGIDYFNDQVYRLTDVYYPATLRLELWSYVFA